MSAFAFAFAFVFASPPTVQQAVNSDISVNKHLGRYPFRGRKCDMSLEAWAHNGKGNGKGMGMGSSLPVMLSFNSLKLTRTLLTINELINLVNVSCD